MIVISLVFGVLVVVALAVLVTRRGVASAAARRAATPALTVEEPDASKSSEVIPVTTVDSHGNVRGAPAGWTRADSSTGTFRFASVDIGPRYRDASEHASVAGSRTASLGFPEPAPAEPGVPVPIGQPRELAARAAAAVAARHDTLEFERFARIQTLGELAASLAHELNQPLSAIRSNAQAARRFLANSNPPIDEVRAILDDIDADDQRAGDVIHSMRALLQRHEVELELLDVNAIVRSVVHLVHGDCVLRRISIVLDLDEPMPLVQCDRVQIQQVLLNLVLNGFDAMRDTQSRDRRLIIRTRAAADDGLAAISVHDAGMGIAAENLPRLFEHFFTTKPDGLGMGLSIARSIVAAHGGRIWATNNSDNGATFHVTLPFAHTGAEP